MIKANAGSFCIISLHRELCSSQTIEFRKIYPFAFFRDLIFMLQPVSDSLGVVIFTCLWQYDNIVIHPLKSIQHGSKYLVAIPFHLLIKISYGIKFLRKSFLKKSYFGICFVFLLKNNVIPSATMAWRKVMCPGVCIKPAIYEPNSQVVIQATPTPSFVLVLMGLTSIIPHSIYSLPHYVFGLLHGLQMRFFLPSEIFIEQWSPPT